MAVLSLSRLGFVAPPYPRTSSGRLASSCRAIASGGGGPPRRITVAGDPPTVVSAPGRRIVAIGDAHGDLSQTRAALVLAGVLSAESDGHVWTGGRTVSALDLSSSDV